jgi:hypothetical protein
MLENLDAGHVRGHKVGSGEWQEFSAKEVTEFVGQDPSLEVQVEEQYGNSYIVHLGSNWEYWIFIDEDTALFRAMRRAHEEQTR